MWAWPEPQARRVLTPEESGPVIYRIDRLNPKAEVIADRNTARQSQGSGRPYVCGISDGSWDADQDVNLDLEVSLFGAW